MSVRRVLIVARLHGLDLIRRRLVLVLLVAMPVVIYLAMGDDPAAVVVGGTLMTFSIAGPAVFVLLAGRGIDQRLTLAGYRPVDLVLGRLLLLDLVGLVVAMLFGSLVVALSSPPEPVYTVAGVVAMAFLAVPFGLALGALLPGDLESMLAMMGVVGVQLVAPPTSLPSKAMPYHGPMQMLRLSNESDVDIGAAAAHACVWFVVLVGLTVLAVTYRSRIHRGPEAAAQPGT